MPMRLATVEPQAHHRATDIVPQNSRPKASCRAGKSRVGRLPRLWLGHNLQADKRYRTDAAVPVVLHVNPVQSQPMAGPSVDGLAAAHLAKVAQRRDFADHRRVQGVLLRTWNATRPLPLRAERQILACDNELKMLEQLDLPGPPTDPRNRIFSSRAAAYWLVRHPLSPQLVTNHIPDTDEPRRAPPYNFWQGFCSRSKSFCSRKAGPAACEACWELFTPEHKAFKLNGCRHAAALDRRCYAAYVSSSGGESCPVRGCQRRLNCQELLTIGIPGTQIDATCAEILRRGRQLYLQWVCCPTPSCPLGTLLSMGLSQNFVCRCCGVRTVVNSSMTNLALMDGGDKKYLRMLIVHALTPLPNAPLDYKGPPRLVRECYHCGEATEHFGGCPEMFCRKGLGRWHFFLGQNVAAFSSSHQSYVPCAGLLVSLGLFHPLAPGSFNLSVSAALRSNAMRMGVFRSFGEIDLACHDAAACNVWLRDRRP